MVLICFQTLMTSETKKEQRMKREFLPSPTLGFLHIYNMLKPFCSVWVQLPAEVKSSLPVLACFLGWFQCTPPSCTCKIKEKVTMPCHVAQNTQSPNHFCVYTKKSPLPLHPLSENRKQQYTRRVLYRLVNHFFSNLCNKLF
jgi:hypothetical protein